MKLIATIHILECEIKRIDEEISRINHRIWRLNTAITALKKTGTEDFGMQEDVKNRQQKVVEWEEWKKDLEGELSLIKELSDS